MTVSHPQLEYCGEREGWVRESLSSFNDCESSSTGVLWRKGRLGEGKLEFIQCRIFTEVMIKSLIDRQMLSKGWGIQENIDAYQILTLS